MLLSLAPELIQAISHELKSAEDIKSFRLTCTQTGQALATEVLHRITVNVNTETSEKELSKLHYLMSAAEGSSSRLAVQGIRQVDIKSLSPALNPKEPWDVTGISDWEDNQFEIVQTFDYYEKELKKCLYRALSSLTTVKTVRWIPAVKDSEWAHAIVLEVLKSYSNLQNLSIELQSCRIEIPFHTFTTLRHISVFCVGEDPDRPLHHAKSFDNLINMIAQSPLLESIDFTNNYNYKRRKLSTRSLHHLFEHYPEDESVPPLRLKRLALASCLVRLDDEVIMRHLRYLTSLTLEDLLEPLPPIPNVRTIEPADPADPSSHPDEEEEDNAISNDILDKQNRWGSSYQHIWETIHDAALKLEEITLYIIPPAFVEYIASYSGLKKLTIGTGGFKDGTASDSAGKRFYEALEKHADSIEELDISAYYEGLWCFGHHNKTLISTFQNLKTLNMKVQSNDLVPKVGYQDIITVLIDTVVIHIPHLQALSASIADLDFDRHNVCGMDTYFRYSRYNQKIVVRVLEYRAPRECKRLPKFTVNQPIMGSKRVFVGQSLDLLRKGDKLRYEDISSPGNFEYPDSVDSDYSDESE